MVTPYRDRFQSYRQTFRIEPNPLETKRIIDNIIGEKNNKEFSRSSSS